MVEEVWGFPDPGTTHRLALEFSIVPMADRGRTDRTPDRLRGAPMCLIGHGLGQSSQGGSVLNPGFSFFSKIIYSQLRSVNSRMRCILLFALLTKRE